MADIISASSKRTPQLCLHCTSRYLFQRKRLSAVPHIRSDAQRALSLSHVMISALKSHPAFRFPVEVALDACTWLPSLSASWVQLYVVHNARLCATSQWVWYSSCKNSCYCHWWHNLKVFVQVCAWHGCQPFMQVLLAIVLDISDTCLRTKHVAIPQKQRLLKYAVWT